MELLDTAIIGAGLAGLSLATELWGRGADCTVFEARDRCGGRILSAAPSPVQPASPFRFDLGPSWIWTEAQPEIEVFLRRFEIGEFPQWQQGANVYMAQRETEPQTYWDENSYAGAGRITGGTIALIDALLSRAPAAALRLEHRLREVIDHGEYVELRFSKPGEWLSVSARTAVITLPPRLVGQTIRFAPTLDADLTAVMANTPTWMAGHAKAVVRYREPFWRAAGLSGNGFAIYPGAALREIFDACSADGEIAAVSGFFGLPAAMRSRYRDDLEALVLEQLVRLFGAEAARPEEVLLKDWSVDEYTAVAADQIPPTDHPQYGHPALQVARWKDKLYFAGTETAGHYGGYLEGALESAARVARRLSP